MPMVNSVTKMTDRIYRITELGSDVYKRQPLTYIVTYMVCGESRSASGAVTVKKKGGNPKLNLTVTSDKKAVEPGEKVTFTYTCLLYTSRCV